MHEDPTKIEESINSDYNILDLAKNLVKTSLKKTEEKNLIILGEKSSGKTSLFNNILLNFTQKETYTPTCGINYSFIRYQPNSNKKLIMNVYEIGGGNGNIGLVKTILNEKNLKNTIFVLNLDFSRPASILQSLREYLKQLGSILKDLFNSEYLMEVIENKSLKYKDTNSSDFKRINIFPAELIVVGNKYDCLEKIDLEKIKWTCRTLRFFCFINSISLVYFKSGDSKLSKIFNSLVTNLAFNVNNDNSLNFSQKNDILPLYVLYGSDSIQEIGDPKVIGQGGKDMASLWEDTFFSVFNKDKESKIESQFDIEENLDVKKFEENLKEKYKESRIDEELVIFE
jgi:GTPase SAR1 family protein